MGTQQKREGVCWGVPRRRLRILRTFRRLAEGWPWP
jgi:hypothetical protein